MQRQLSTCPRTLAKSISTTSPPLLLFLRPITTTYSKSSAPAPSITSRPQLPFLASSSYLPPSRQFTTERKRGSRFARIAKWGTIYISTTVCVFVIAYTIQEETLERKYPTPREWSHFSRSLLHTALSEIDRPAGGEAGVIDWVTPTIYADVVRQRCEDKKTDGDGVRELVVGEGDAGGVPMIEGVGKLGCDVTEKSEEWRRGYYQALMLLAKGTEHLEGAMKERTTYQIWRKEYIIGPSFPNPQPLPAGQKRASPREEDCDPAFEPPPNYYMRILTTKGFTNKQKMDAALACASYYEYKKLAEPAERMHLWALSLAVRSTPNAPPPFDKTTLVLNDTPSAPPSTNVLDALTSLATFRAARGDISSALPILVSLLRVRRAIPVASSSESLPDLPGFDQKSNVHSWSWFIHLFKEPPYPPPPSDGTAPPIRDSKALCEEAALGLYIGEILFALGKREDGLSWTREGVDVAEEQLRALDLPTLEPEERPPPEQMEPTRIKCRECLRTGLANWTKMAALLAREEDEKKKMATSSSVFFWKSAGQADQSGRWADEQKVVEARAKRTGDLLSTEQKAPDASMGALVQA